MIKLSEMLGDRESADHRRKAHGVLLFCFVLLIAYLAASLPEQTLTLLRYGPGICSFFNHLGILKSSLIQMCSRG